MKPQTGCIFVKNGNAWALRWRETVRTPSGLKRKMRFRLLGPVLPEHKRNKDRATSKLRIPPEIQTAADEILGVVNASDSPVLTINQFMDSVYLPEKEQHLKPGSYENILHRWNRYLKARIGHLVLRDFRRQDAALLWKELHKDFPHLASQTFRHIRFSVRGIYELAKDQGLYVGENPASASLPPNLPGKKETYAYSVEEVARMLSLFTARPQVQALIALAFGSGCRKGELAALAWNDYEPTPAGAILHIRRSCWRGKLQTPKNASSADDTAIDSEICSYVEAYRALLGGVNQGLMFCYSPTRPINLDSLLRWQINPILRKAGIPWKGWHAFRRGNATYLASKHGMDGAGAQTAALLLRHSDSSTTEDHYIKQSKQDRRAGKAAKVISIRSQRQQAAATIGAGLKKVRAN